MAITVNEPCIQPLSASWYSPFVQQIDILRLDILHPVVSGNKWYKLKCNIQFSIEQGHKTILTFGGGYSNHLVAAAATAQQFGLGAVGIVRGQYDQLTPTLLACKEYGMELAFIPHEQYKRKADEVWLNKLLQQYNQPYVIPEGGANQQGREGTEEISQDIPSFYTHICLSVGTGTTFIGLRNSIDAAQQLLGYVPMKGGAYIKSDITPFLKEHHNTNWVLFDEYHFGGFGKWNSELVAFMNDFYIVNNIPLDIVYTSKMMFGIRSQLRAGYFPVEAKILCIHTGGLQGNSSVAEKLIY